MSYSQLVLDDAARKIVASAIAEGNIEINTTSEVDVRGYATAQANSENIVPENIRKGVSILGVAGDFGDALTFNIAAVNCRVTLFRFIDTEWVDISEGEDQGEIALGASYRATVIASGDNEVNTFKCNGLDLVITSNVEEATDLLVDPTSGLDILAIASGSGSSSSDAE